MARLLNLWWIPLAAIIAAAIGWETNWGEALNRPLSIPAAPEVKAPSPVLLPEYKPTAGPEAYAEVIDRPLFSPTRRQAPPPPPPEPPKQIMQTGLYQLTGTIEVGDKLYAFLKETRGGKGIRAAQGDILSSGIKLLKVEPDRIVLTQFDSEEEVKMQVSKSTRATPVPAPPPGTPGTPGAPPAPAAPAGGTAVPPPVRANIEPVPPAPAQPPPPAAGTPFMPGGPTVAPFVPGVSGATSVESPPRRRGAMQ